MRRYGMLILPLLLATGCPKSLRQYLYDKAKNDRDFCINLTECVPPQPSSLSGGARLLTPDEMTVAGDLSIVDTKALAREWLFQMADAKKWGRGHERCGALSDTEILVDERPLAYEQLSETIDTNKLAEELRGEISLPPGIPLGEQPRVRQRIAAETTSRIAKSHEGAGRIITASVTKEAIAARNLNSDGSGYGAWCKKKAPSGFVDPVLFTGVTLFIFKSSLSESTESQTKNEIIAAIEGIELDDHTLPFKGKAAADIFAKTESSLRTKLSVKENVGLMFAGSNISLNQFVGTATPPEDPVTCTLPKGSRPLGNVTCSEQPATELLSSGKWDRFEISGRFSTGMNDSNSATDCKVQLAFGQVALGVLEPGEQGNGKNPITIAERAFLRSEVINSELMTFNLSTPWGCRVRRGGADWVTGTPGPDVGELKVRIYPKAETPPAQLPTTPPTPTTPTVPTTP